LIINLLFHYLPLHQESYVQLKKLM